MSENLIDEIISNLYVGDISSSEKFQGIVCNVLETKTTVRKDAHWFPILNNKLGTVEVISDAQWFPILNDELGTVDIIQLENLFRFVNKARIGRPETPILIHCGAGVERSPLATAYVIFRMISSTETYNAMWKILHETVQGNPHDPLFIQAYKYVKIQHPRTQYRLSWIPKWFREGLAPSSYTKIIDEGQWSENFTKKEVKK